MSSSRKLLSALALVLLVLDVDSSSSSSSGNVKPSSTDLRGRDLINLLNSRVYLAEKMSTPFDSSANNLLRILGFRHSGVRVTLSDGSKWLVHKGNKFGRSSQTVVTDARYMGRGWEVERTKNFRGSQTVSDLIRVGGRHYDLVFDNCHHAANRIMNLP